LKIIRLLFKQNKILNLLNSVIAIVLFLFLVALAVNMQQASLEVGAMKHFKDKNIYQISDDLVNEIEGEFFKKKYNYDKLNEFASMLEQSTAFQYYKANWQPIDVLDFKGDKVFGAYYESGDTEHFKKDDRGYHFVKSIQISKSVIPINNVQLIQGRFFDEDEYVLQENSIPIILGAEYSSIYKLGDEIKIEYYFKQFTGTVVGILQPSQKIVTTNRPELILDRYMIIPALSLPDAPSRLLKNATKYPIFFKASLLSRANGVILSELDPLAIRKVVGEIADKAVFDQFAIIGADGPIIQTLAQMTETNRMTLVFLSILLLLIAISALFVTLYMKTKKNVDTYKVLLISGATLEHVCKMLGFQFVMTYFIGSILPLLIILLLTNFSISILSVYILLVILFLIIVFTVSYVFAKKFFTKMDLVRELKG